MHYVIAPELDPNLELVAIDGEQARHAIRVRRMQPGEPLVLLDGAGTSARATVESSDKNGPNASWRLLVRLERIQRHPRQRPEIHVVCPAPKGDLLETMIDQLSQVGATSWRPLTSDRSEREPREGKLDRLGRVAQESAKQCGRAWFFEIEKQISLESALALPNAVLADAQGLSPAELITQGLADRQASHIHVLIGPEGGFSSRERSLAQEAGLGMMNLGPHVLRIGTAAVVAASGLVHTLGRGVPDSSRPEASAGERARE